MQSLAEEFFGTEALSNNEPLYDSSRPGDPYERKPSTRVTLTPLEPPTEAFPRGFGIGLHSEYPIRSEHILERYAAKFARLLATFGVVTVENPLPLNVMDNRHVGQARTLFHFDDGNSYDTRRNFKMNLLAGPTDAHTPPRLVPLWVVDTQIYKPQLGAVIDRHIADPNTPATNRTALNDARELLETNPHALNRISALASSEPKKAPGQEQDLFKLFAQMETEAFLSLTTGRYVHGYERVGFTTRHIVTAASGLACAPKVAHGKLIYDPERTGVESLTFPLVPDPAVEGPDAIERWLAS